MAKRLTKNVAVRQLEHGAVEDAMHRLFAMLGKEYGGLALLLILENEEYARAIASLIIRRTEEEMISREATQTAAPAPRTRRQKKKT